jgi:hypothetical protein
MGFGMVTPFRNRSFASHNQLIIQNKIDHRPDVNAAFMARGGGDKNCPAAAYPMVPGNAIKPRYSANTAIF